LDWLFQDLVVGVSTRINAVARGEQAPPVKGLEVTDDGRVRITLNSPTPGFLQVLAHQGCWIYPAEMVTHYGKEVPWHPVGTGPFRMKSFKRGTSLILERNERYWGSDELGNKLPFLDAVRYTFEKDKNVELDGFEKGHLSMVSELPVERTQVLDTYADGRYVVQSTPGMSVQFYGFNRRMAPFQELRVRKAFSMAIDRQTLVDSVLNGLAVAAEHGVVPPGFADYPYDSVPRTAYDPEGARSLLTAAGYPDGRGLPSVLLQVNSDGFGYVRVAGVVQAMLEKVLGVSAVITVLPAEQHFERVERSQSQFWREGWVADHPDPENFLAMFYGRNAPADSTAPSYLNSTRYADERFDAWFAKAQVTADRTERMGLLAKAERQLMEDMVVIPLYHERTVRVLQPWVRDLPINGMDFIDLRGAWFDQAIMRSQKSLP
jgi:peptide/nickel transport system substrate-binding protein